MEEENQSELAAFVKHSRHGILLISELNFYLAVRTPAKNPASPREKTVNRSQNSSRRAF